MPEPSPTSPRPLRIVHVLRAPVGGLFRHVLDVADAQAARGHPVGIVADAGTGGATAEAALARLAPRLALGVLRLPMRRDPHPADLMATARIAGHLRALVPDVVHGHGSKGGLYARLPGLLPGSSHGPARVYTPHGGSLHYAPGTARHALFSRVERLLGHCSDLILFESAYAAARYEEAIGPPPCPARIVLNGLHAAEFEPVRPDADAADFLYVGELRALKGVDTFLDAFAEACTRTGRALRAVLVGSGPDRAAFEAWALRLGLTDSIRFAGQLPAREAFRLGRVLVVPSRAESLPYIVLEAAAARVPLVATDVGGIPEIFGPMAGRLVPPKDPARLCERMLATLAAAATPGDPASAALAAHVGTLFRVDRMVDGILAGYRDALGRHSAARMHGPRPLGFPEGASR